MFSVGFYRAKSCVQMKGQYFVNICEPPFLVSQKTLRILDALPKDVARIQVPTQAFPETLEVSMGVPPNHLQYLHRILHLWKPPFKIAMRISLD